MYGPQVGIADDDAQHGVGGYLMRRPHYSGPPINKGHYSIANVYQVGLRVRDFRGMGRGREIFYNLAGRKNHPRRSLGLRCRALAYD